MNIQYFKTTETNYEEIRSTMDNESGYPSTIAETWFVPAARAVRDSENNCLIAAKPQIAEKFLLSNAIEITEEEYVSYLSD